MEPFGRLPFLFPLAWFFQDTCFGWVTMAAVSFIWGSFCLMNGKGWEILKISPSACRENRAILMSSHKVGVEQEAAWPSSARNGLKPCLLVWSLPKPSLSRVTTQYVMPTSLSEYRCPPPGSWAVLLNLFSLFTIISPQGVGPQASHTSVVTT